MPGDPFRPEYRGVPPGTQLNGIYEIEKLVAAGGMGEIYKGREIQTGVTVAIKMLLPDMAENTAALELFRREASALHHLPHDAIVRYFLFTVEPILQRPYLAMEFVDGRSLSDLLADGPLPFESVVSLIQRVASALQVAHVRGIVHRDVSPDNIIIPFDDVTRAKIIDFGIARSTQLADPTIIGSGFAGKHNYVSPEQVGLFGHDVTFKSDIYSLGLVVYHATTGTKLDMGGSQFQLVEKRRRVPDLGNVDARVRPLLERMLQPDPADRPASMTEIASWTWPKNASSPVQLRKDSFTSPAAASRKSFATMTSFLVLTLCFIGVASIVYYYLVWADSPPIKSVEPPTLTVAPKSAALPEPAASPADPRVMAPPMDKTASPAPLLPPTSGSPTDRARAYVDQYDGGDCFLVVPIAISQSVALVEAFGASPKSFESFGTAFRREQNLNPSIGARQVSDAQCSAIRFLSKMKSNRGRAPRINIASADVKDGETLSGTIDNVANRSIELLLITADGVVQNLSSFMKSGLDSQSFAFEVKRGESGTVPGLLMAVSTQQSLDKLRPRSPVLADQFFAQFNDSDIRAMTASARHFRLTGK